ncbi:hypothetical protein G9A89_014752 [Geosiphon pyriformis]|nr:hypothetical protein G9A89_014752 [Geosiphon pyriformis]
MEDKIEILIEKLYKTDGVKGVLIADQNGLCLGARGIGHASSAGFITAIASNAKSLYKLDEQQRRAKNDGIIINSGNSVGGVVGGIETGHDTSVGVENILLQQEQIGIISNIISNSSSSSSSGISNSNSSNSNSNNNNNIISIGDSLQKLTPLAPTIKIETEANRTILIHSEGNHTLAIFK